MTPKVLAQREALVAEDDPVWQAALNAPLDDEPESLEERRQVAAAKAEAARGARMRSQGEVAAMIADRRVREG